MSIKTRVWLLAWIFLGGLLTILLVHYRVTSEELARNAAMLERLGRIERLSRLIHELQRERGLTAILLSSREERHADDLLAQRVAVDLKVQELDPPLPEHFLGQSGLMSMRSKVDSLEVQPREAFNFYTFQIASMLGEVNRVAMAAGGHPMQADLFAHDHLIQAKEQLGQVRAMLMTTPQPGHVDLAWGAELGRHVGLFETSLEMFLRDANPALESTMQAALQEQDMLVARRLIGQAMTGRASATELPRRQTYSALTAAIDLLREMERYSSIELRQRTQDVQHAAQRAILWQRSGLLLIAGVLAYLAISSLKILLRALESALRGARRAAGGRGRADPSELGGRDEAGEIAQGFNQLLDLVDQLNLKATTDALTGAMNRHGFTEVSAGELERAQRYGRPLSMIILDLDHFKSINDRHGHAVGDQVLRELSRLIREKLRAADIFARWGGEEFVILTPETSAEDAGRIAEKLRLLIREHRAAGLPRFTASFGVAESGPDDGVDLFFAKADQSLYRAKHEGRDCVVVHRAGSRRPAAGPDISPRRVVTLQNHSQSRR